MQNLLSTVIAAALLSGCQTADQGLPPSSDAGAVTGPAASAIAGDMVSRLAEQIGPATAMTTIRMDKDTSEFAIALEAALKGWGYTVVTDKKLVRGIKPVELAYAAESLDGQILARLSTPSIALGRAYRPTGAGAMPASPLSILQRN